jgi:hypothetical protein
MSMLSRAVGALLLTLVLAAQAAPQAPVLSLEGKVRQPQHWTLDDLKKMPGDRLMSPI